MATTPNGLPYPVGTDRVMDGDDAIKALATAIRVFSTTVTVNLSTSPTAAILVTFPAGLFTAPPVVVGFMNGAGTTAWRGGANTVTATSCQLFAQSNSGSGGSGTATVSCIAAQIP